MADALLNGTQRLTHHKHGRRQHFFQGRANGQSRPEGQRLGGILGEGSIFFQGRANGQSRPGRRAEAGWDSWGGAGSPLPSREVTWGSAVSSRSASPWWSPVQIDFGTIYADYWRLRFYAPDLLCIYGKIWGQLALASQSQIWATLP